MSRVPESPVTEGGGQWGGTRRDGIKEEDQRMG